MHLSLERYAGLEPDYPGAGGTGTGAFPPGFRSLRHRFVIGAGEQVMARAADAVLSFRMHRAAGMRLVSSAPVAAPGVTVVGAMGLGPLRVVAPCRVVWADGPGGTRAGFGYGTLPGHPARGEEGFAVELAGDGQVWLIVESFSLPARWFTRAAGPAMPLLQSVWARRCGASLRKLV